MARGQQSASEERAGAPDRVRVFLAIPSELERTLLSEWLTRSTEVEVVGATGELTGAAPIVEAARAQVALVAACSPTAPRLLRELASELQEVRVIALGVSGTDEELIASVEAGVSCFFPRSGSPMELLEAVKAVVRGETPCPPQVAAVLLRRVSALAQHANVRPDEEEGLRERGRLTPRERQIAGLLEEGLSNKEIARRLVIRVHTVKSHVHNILSKLDVSRRSDAAARLRGHRGDLHST